MTTRTERQELQNGVEVRQETHLVVPIVGSIMQGRVVIQAFGIHLCTRSQQLLGNIVVASVTCLVQCCPAWKQTLRTYVI